MYNILKPIFYLKVSIKSGHCSTLVTPANRCQEVHKCMPSISTVFRVDEVFLIRK